MWAIKVLNGLEKGKVFSLKSGKNIIGRSSVCDIILDLNGISKVHAEIWVDDNKFKIVDKQSSNGTYIDGVKVIRQNIDIGDHICLHDTFIEVVPNSSYKINPFQQPAYYNPLDSKPKIEEKMHANLEGRNPKNFIEWAHHYLEEVVLTGVYKLLSWFDLKWVMSFFVIGFILSVTILSVIPLTRILHSSLETEGMNHAKSIALALSRENKKPLTENVYTALNVDFAQRRPGVKQALIIQAVDGKILAPAHKVNKYPKQAFIHQIRQSGQAVVRKVNSSTIVAMIPVKYFNSQTGSHQVMAYATVIYDLGVLAKNTNQTISLAVQSFFIASIIGVILFFFLYKMIIRPISELDDQLSIALKDDSQSLSTDYQMGNLQSLCSNINSALERMSSAHDEIQLSSSTDRTAEMTNLVEMVGFPCLAINLESSTVSAINQQFEEQTGLSSENLLYQAVDNISDIPLKLNLQDAIKTVTENHSQIYTSNLEFNSQPFQIIASGVLGSKEISYILISFMPTGHEGEEVA